MYKHSFCLVFDNFMHTLFVSTHIDTGTLTLVKYRAGRTGLTIAADATAFRFIPVFVSLLEME